MTNPKDLNPSLLQQYVGDMVALERQTEALLEQQQSVVAPHSKAAEAARRFYGTVKIQREMLEARLQALGGSAPDSLAVIAPAAIGPVPADAGGAQAVSKALHTLYTAFNHAALGYALLHAVAHRFSDSLGHETSAHLAEAGLRRYAAAIQEINQLISDVVVWELHEAGLECQCQCPGCGLGLCVCAPHGTNTINQAWRETSPAAPGDAGLWLRPPRAGSAAAHAGLDVSDVIIAVDDQVIASDLDVPALQAAIDKHPSGEAVRLRVLRGSSELEATVVRP